MAKFCGNCGARMEDGDRICGNCGTPFSSSSYTPRINVVDNERKQKTAAKVKKYVKLGIALVAVALVAVLAINIISGFTGANGLLKKVMKAYENYDIDSLITMSSDLYFFTGDDYAEAYFENAVGYALDSFESSVGHNYDLSYEVNEIYSLSNRGFSSALEELSWDFIDFDTSIIDEIVVAEITVTAEQGKRTSDRDVTVTMTKENGAWKLLYIG